MTGIRPGGALGLVLDAGGLEAESLDTPAEPRSGRHRPSAVRRRQDVDDIATTLDT
ncbi:hypothetical protein ABZ439_20125 [Streptomyces sp. NPDC005840]|uniref:hypothetical protein n=1 Tax=Streptomyces sp. NPDC005840 TaxID=3157072 RepID=UPI0033CBC6BB